MDLQIAAIQDSLSALLARLSEIQQADGSDARRELLRENLDELTSLVEEVNESWATVLEQIQADQTDEDQLDETEDPGEQWQGNTDEENVPPDNDSISEPADADGDPAINEDEDDNGGNPDSDLVSSAATDDDPALLVGDNAPAPLDEE